MIYWATLRMDESLFSTHGTFYISYKLFVSLCYKDPKHPGYPYRGGPQPIR